MNVRSKHFTRVQQQAVRVDEGLFRSSVRVKVGSGLVRHVLCHFGFAQVVALDFGFDLTSIS